MKRILGGLFAVGFCSISIANESPLSALFNVNLVGNQLAITTTVKNPKIAYPAGIKLSQESAASGYSISAGCTPSPNGMCLFSVNSDLVANIGILGGSGTLTYTLCLNGRAPLSCQNYSLDGMHVAYVGTFTGGLYHFPYSLMER